MLTQPLLILICLASIVSAVLYLNQRPELQKLFQIIPFICWIFFLPMLASTFGWIDPKSSLYKPMTDWLLPASLGLLLTTVDIRSIFRLGPIALGAFLIGSFSVSLGMIVAFKIFSPILGTQYWKGFGALCGSWTGGSANMIAVKEALQTPDNIFLPFVVIDSVLPYLWMAILISGAHGQERIDRWNRIDPQILDDIKNRIRPEASDEKHTPITFFSLLKIITIGILIAGASHMLSKFAPAVKDVLSPFTWVIIIASSIGLILSCTPVKNVAQQGSNPIAYFFLYLVLTSIGAKANLSQITQAVILIPAGVTVIAVHGMVLFSACRIFRIPLSLAAAASQANLGGVASAPIVAEIYSKGLAPVGLILAVTGNVIGTYIGIMTAHLCRLLS